MKRYFFDVVSDTGAEFDYRGREFAATANAIEFAKLMAIDLGIMNEEDARCSKIIIRDLHGRSYFAAPVELAAAA